MDFFFKWPVETFIAWNSFSKLLQKFEIKQNKHLYTQFNFRPYWKTLVWKQKREMFDVFQ